MQSIPRSGSRNADVEVQYEVAAASPSTPVNDVLSATDSARHSQPGDTDSGVAKVSDSARHSQPGDTDSGVAKVSASTKCSNLTFTLLGIIVLSLF